MSAFRSLIAVSVVVAAPLAAQVGGFGFQLVKAVKDDDRGAFNKIIADRSRLNAAVLDYVSDGETALHVAVRTNNRAFVNDLLYYRANPNVLNAAGDTPLILAVMAGNQDLAELLLRGRAGLDFANRRGETALIKAVNAHSFEMVRFLLGKGADPDRADRFGGKSARQYALDHPRFTTIVKALSDAPRKSARPVSGPKLN
ncbi:MAG: ankyrin repeat domain-containing protein [Pseudomonadota bacterium]